MRRRKVKASTSPMQNIDGFCVTQMCWGEPAEWAEVELIHSSLSVCTCHMGSLKRCISSPRWPRPSTLSSGCSASHTMLAGMWQTKMWLGLRLVQHWCDHSVFKLRSNSWFNCMRLLNLPASWKRTVALAESYYLLASLRVHASTPTLLELV